MKKLFSASQIVAPFRMKGADLEACATADADFDEGNSQLVMELDSFVRATNLRCNEQRWHPDWLPEKQTFKESVSQGEASELARDIFHRWVGTVHHAVTMPVHN
jgi:hypothetical protein